MSARYEINLDPCLADFVRERIVDLLAKEGFEKILELSDPEGPDILQFKSGDYYASMSFRTLPGGSVNLALESEAPSAEEMIVRVVHQLASELLIPLIKGLPRCERKGLEEKVQLAVGELIEWATPTSRGDV